MKIFAIVVGTLVLLALPFVSKSYVVFQMTMMFIYAIAILGLNLLTGFNGQFSLGHAAFYAVGAYTAAILMNETGISYLMALPVAAAVSFAVGFLFGLPARRLDGIYLALATFALSVATPQMLKLSPLEHWTGGVQGMFIMKPDAPFGLAIDQDQWFYYFTLFVTVLAFGLAANMLRSRTGRAVVAIRDNPIAASTMGINNALYKPLVFGVSAAFTGLAGALGAIAVQFVAPESFTVTLSIALLVGLVVGGVAWVPGAFFGAAFILFVPNLAEGFSKGLSGAVYGVILMFLIFVMPSGVAGLRQVIVNRLRMRGPGPAE